MSKGRSVGVAVLIRNFGKDRARGSSGGSRARLAVNMGREGRFSGVIGWLDDHQEREQA